MSLDAEAAALLADIDAFDMEAARRRVREIDSRHKALPPSQISFPDIPATPPKGIGGLGELQPDPRQVSSPAVAPVRVPPESAGPASRNAHSPRRNEVRESGLLDQLRDEVSRRQSMVTGEAERIEQARARLDRQLRSIFDYLHDLSSQLNYLKPEIDRVYYFLDANDAFRNLSWVEGFADFRTQAEKEGGRIERVILAYTLKGAGQRVVERAGLGVDRLRQVLFDLGLKFECRERRNRQREVEQGWFTVLDEISVQVVLRADFDNETVVVESRNLERLGYAQCVIGPHSIGRAMLDDLGRLILGRENNFRSHLIR